MQGRDATHFIEGLLMIGMSADVLIKWAAASDNRTPLKRGCIREMEINCWFNEKLSNIRSQSLEIGIKERNT